MPLDPHAKRFLDMVAVGGMQDVSRLTPADMREQARRLAQTVNARDVAIGQIEDGELPGPAGPLRFRIHVPLAGGSPSPGLVYFHGGGGVFGGLDTHEVLCRMLANASGCRVIAVAYRLAPEHRFPAAVEDADAAARWIAAHAAELRIDSGRIAVGGDSAGAGLATVVCQRATRTDGPKLALQVLLCPTTDMSAETESRRAFAKGYFFDRTTIVWALGHYAPGADLTDPRISPLHAVDLRGLPPAHIHTAEFDPLRDEGKAYADRLERAGVKVNYTCHKGMIHHFYGMAGAIPYARTAVKAAGAAIKAALA